ncbi:MAG: Na/Pi cotransporter [Owenweeksia sp.]|nr:Na/Pi cotransporter [Owenweeksia sp.]MBF99908.1 Na/Pi cotransporter [Owenweeksia sp.]HBF20676.1 Na/Pi cotransporter [Cryomorphaceae bacterium]HCQ17181.1 Na/Pi cotransporter [Cryomorphaceae bacterium]|tara:strand:+ start:1864 stop:3597 length:1734 start_codon:yes stop_codon:yes gene_type:complete
MSFGIFDFLTLIGALGIFIYGMKVMSDAIQKVAGSKLREILGAMTSNRFFGIFTGLLITSLVQSSSATTVMVVSFVNAGLLSLVESIGVIMGANIGTTVTAWLISILGLGKFSISALCLPIVAVGFPMMFAGREKIKLWGEVLIGFALLFLGLAFMKDAVPDLKSHPEVLQFLSDLTYDEKGLVGKFLISLIFVGIGTLLTIVVQSSSAAMALTLVMCNEGWISFPLAASIVLGENIGTTITANLAALIANVHAKRAARAHFIFNVFGVLWMLLLLPFFLNIIASLTESVFGSNPYETATSIPKALALFHTSFNILNVLIMVGFVGIIAKVVTRMVPSKGEDEVFSLDYIGSGLMATPELSIIEARKELAKFADLMRRAYKYVPRLVTEMEEKKFKKYVEKLENYEDISDRMEIEIATYLTKASAGDLSSEASARVRSMLSVANYLERIGDIYLEISRNLDARKKKKAYFTQEIRDRVLKLSELVGKAMDLMVSNLEASENKMNFREAQRLEREINTMYQELREEYIKKIEKGRFRLESGMYYSDLISEMERIADHVVSISEVFLPQEVRSTVEEQE